MTSVTACWLKQKKRVLVAALYVLFMGMGFLQRTKVPFWKIGAERDICTKQGKIYR
jgi:hypothetical protein